MTRVGTILKGLGSAMLLVLLIVGVPIVLFRVGAFPSTVPDLPAMWLAATRPDTGNRAVFAVLAVLVWLAWASFTISVLREIAAAIRTRGRRPARPMRGLTWSARPAEILVAAIIAVFVTAPLIGAAATPATAGTAAIAAPSGAATVATASHHAAAVPHAGPRTKSTTATAGNAGSSGEQDHAAKVAPGRTGAGTTSQASGPAPSASATQPQPQGPPLRIPPAQPVTRCTAGTPCGPSPTGNSVTRCGTAKSPTSTPTSAPTTRSTPGRPSFSPPPPSLAPRAPPRAPPQPNPEPPLLPQPHQPLPRPRLRRRPRRFT